MKHFFIMAYFLAVSHYDEINKSICVWQTEKKQFYLIVIFLN